MKATHTLPGHIYKNFTSRTDASGKKTGLKVELNNGYSFLSDEVRGTVGVQTPEGQFKTLAQGRKMGMQFSPHQGLTLSSEQAEMRVSPFGDGSVKVLESAVKMMPIGPGVAAVLGIGSKDYVDRSASLMKGYSRVEHDYLTIGSSDGKSPDTLTKANLHGSGKLARSLGYEFSLPGRRAITEEVSLSGDTARWSLHGQESSTELPASLNYFKMA
jgi:hypothetical protein